MSPHPMNETDHDAGALLHDEIAEVRAAAARWRPGDAFPLLSGDAAERYRRLVAGDGHWPRTAETRWPGVVLSVAGAGAGAGTDAEAAARMLAAATGRPHQHLPLTGLPGAVRRHADGPVAVVGLADDLAGLDDWPGMLAPRLGVLTARDPAALYALVYRTLTAHAVPATRDLLVSHPFQADAREADAVGLDELEELVKEPSRRLVVRSFGRECCVNLPDGVICGRSEPLTAGAAATGSAGLGRVPSCMRGGGCFRVDLEPSQRVSASDIDARTVFLHTCSSIAVGNQVFPPSANLGVGFLSGTAVAVFGAVGVHAAHLELRHEFERAQAEGLPAGDVLERMNVLGHRMHGDMGHFGLLGDPALALPTDTAPAATAPAPDTPVTRTVPVPPTRPGRGVPAADPAALERLRYWHGVVLPGLLRLRWLDVPVDERRLLDLSDRLRQVALAQFSPSPGAEGMALEAELGTVHGRTMELLVEHAHTSWWDFTDSALPALRQEASRPCDCPGCGRPTATAIRYAHRVDRALTLRVVRCRRCGMVRQSTGGPTAPRVDCAGLVQARRGTVLDFNGTLVNPGPRPGPGAIGHAFLAGAHTGLPAGRGEPVDLAAHEERAVSWQVDLTRTGARPHEHELAVFALGGKDLTVTTAWLGLLPE